MPKSFVIMDCTKPNKSPNSSDISLIAILQLCSKSFVNHQLVSSHGGAPSMFITLD
jgi:hypothetical protein